eukprot:TRINITY_DN32255_c0_g1_i2.p1 TRINITY_DN32255_c0_g1~~TRINITY_DN32255_c0_g1_i2.p1  ORF type:complete len:520 (+),score=103.59 TRINITY_DN32255_c0_g1_i2:218-1561(+)
MGTPTHTRSIGDVLKRPAYTQPSRAAVPPQGVKSLRDELEAMVSERFRGLHTDLSDVVKQEWNSKLPELEFGVRERYAELRDLFDRNNKTAINIGEKVVELSGSMDILQRDHVGVDDWRRELDAYLKEIASDVTILQEKEKSLRLKQEALAKEREKWLHKLTQVELLREDHRDMESNLESYVREESRKSEKRSEARIEVVDAKLNRLEQLMHDGDEGRRMLAKRISSAEQCADDAKRDVDKLRDTFATQSAEFEECCEDLYHLREKVTAMTQTTLHGYCEGCRIVSQEFDQKLFSVKESVCFLRELVKGRESEAPLERAPSVRPSSPQQDALSLGQRASDLDAAGLQLLHSRLDRLSQELDDVRRTVSTVRDAQHQARDDVPDSVRQYIADAVARAEEGMLQQIKLSVESLSGSLDSKADHLDVETLVRQVSDLVSRMHKVEDKLEY